MTIIQYRRDFLNVVEVYGKWDMGEEQFRKADLIINTQLLLSPPDSPLVQKNKNWSFQMAMPTFIIDLAQEEKAIFSNIHKKTREKIKQALKNDQLNYSEWNSPTDEQIHSFAAFYDAFAAQKQIDKCHRDKLKALRDNDSLIITSIITNDGKILSYHCYALEKETNQAYGLYSCTPRLINNTPSDRSLIGRANKCLHWNEIKSIKKKGYRWYNMGGIVSGKENEGVNQFKLQMGAIRGYDLKIYQPNSIKGRASTTILYNKWKRRLELSAEQQAILNSN